MSQLHLLSKSIPRAGHHYTAGILRALYGERFFYCEFYQPSAGVCCKSTPCLKRFRQGSHPEGNYIVSMQKSHDFKLLDKVYRTSDSLKYIIFFRNFFDAFKSNIKLFLINKASSVIAEQGIDTRELFNHHDKALFRRALAIVDRENPEISREQFEKFLTMCAYHYVRFTEKWGTVARMKEVSSLVVNYDELSDRAETDFAEKLVGFIGREPLQDVRQAILQMPRMTAEEKKAETSEAASLLFNRFQAEITRCSLLIEHRLKPMNLR